MSVMQSSNQIAGVVVGKVKSTRDPLGEGRILVEFSWMGGRNQSHWAPPATLMSGGGRGSWFMPEKEDEVLVAFDQCKLNHPYIVGFLWNGVDKPPEKDPKNRVIVTPGGHCLRFEDKDNKKKIIIKSNGKHEIQLDDTTGKPSLTIKTNGGLSVLLDDANKKIEISGGGRMITMEGGMVKIS